MFFQMVITDYIKKMLPEKPKVLPLACHHSSSSCYYYNYYYHYRQPSDRGCLSFTAGTCHPAGSVQSGLQQPVVSLFESFPVANCCCSDDVFL